MQKIVNKILLAGLLLVTSMAFSSAMEINEKGIYRKPPVSIAELGWKQVAVLIDHYVNTFEPVGLKVEKEYLKKGKESVLKAIHGIQVFLLKAKKLDRGERVLNLSDRDISKIINQLDQCEVFVNTKWPAFKNPYDFFPNLTRAKIMEKSSSDDIESFVKSQSDGKKADKIMKSLQENEGPFAKIYHEKMHGILSGKPANAASVLWEDLKALVECFVDPHQDLDWDKRVKRTLQEEKYFGNQTLEQDYDYNNFYDYDRKANNILFWRYLFPLNAQWRDIFEEGQFKIQYVTGKDHKSIYKVYLIQINSKKLYEKFDTQAKILLKKGDCSPLKEHLSFMKKSFPHMVFSEKKYQIYESGLLDVTENKNLPFNLFVQCTSKDISFYLLPFENK